MKRLLLSAVVLSSMGLNAQVGINTESPQATLEVAKKEVDLSNPTGEAQGVIFPNFTTAERETFTNVKKGTLIYNTTKDCVEVYTDGLWKCLSSTASAETSGENNNTADLGNNVSVTTIGDGVNYVASLTYNGTTHQGVIDGSSNKITVKIPYTGGSGSISEVTVTSNTLAGANEDSETATKPIKMRVLPGTMSGDGFITVEITTDEEFKVKMLPPNGQPLKVAEFKLKVGEKENTVTVNAIGGIPDKKFGEGRKYIYTPFKGPDGNTWLNQNLGADYANVDDSGHFNPAKIGGGNNRTDKHAYGDLYQWQRGTDGHQSLSSDTRSTQASSWTPGHGDFINGSSTWNRNSTFGPDNLWAKDTDNNPCPTGYRVPTKSEWEQVMTADEINKLGLSAAGYRQWGFGSVEHRGSHGYYWASTWITDSSSFAMHFDGSGSGSRWTSSAANGYSIRCLRDKK